MISDADKAFLAALRAFCTRGGYGEKTRLIKATGYSEPHILKLLSGERTVSRKCQQAIAEYYDLSLSEFLRIGENLLAGLPFFPYSAKIRGLDRREQADVIMNAVLEETGLGGCIVSIRPKSYAAFIDGACDNVEFYNSYIAELESLIDAIENRKRQSPKSGG